MKKAVISILALFLILALQKSYAQTENSLLWKISGKGLTQTSYLFGTIHLICPDDYIWTDKMQQALEQTDQLCMEVALNDFAAMNQFRNSGGTELPGDSTIRDFFTEAEYDTLKTYFKDSLRIQIEPFFPYRPFVMYGSLSLLTMGCDAPIGYEEDLISKNSARGVRKVIGLETFEEQGKYLNNMSQDSMTRMILDMVKNMRLRKEESKSLSRDYAQQNLGAITNMINNSPLFRDNLVKNRNKNWIPKMEEIIKAAPTFIAVGVGHLGGDGGVIQLLRSAGYEVEAVI